MKDIHLKAHRILRYTLATICMFLVTLAPLTPAKVFSAAYGCGTYGSNEYNKNCPVPKAAITPPASATNEATTTEAPSAGTTIILNTYESFFEETGISVTNLEVGDVVTFCKNNESECRPTDDDKHTITVKKIDVSDPTNPKIILTFASTPFDVEFVKGATKLIDVDKDGINDLEVTFVDLVGDKPVVTIKKLVLAATTTNTSVDTDAAVVDEQTGMNWVWPALTACILLVMIVLGVAWFRKNNRQPPTNYIQS